MTDHKGVKTTDEGESISLYIYVLSEKSVVLTESFDHYFVEFGNS